MLLKRIKVIFLIVLILSISLFLVSSLRGNGNSWDLADSQGICGGFGTKFISEIPVGVISAVDKYFRTPFKNSTVGEYATEVNPLRESTTPHQCKGLNNIQAPGYPPPAQLSASEKKEISARRSHYSGVIPPGAIRALEVNSAFSPKLPNFLESDSRLNSYLNTFHGSISLGRTLIVAYYRGVGWKVVYEFGLQHGGYATE